MIVAVGQERPLGSRTDPWLRFGDDTDVHAQPARKRWFGRRGGNPRRAPFGRRLLLVADQPAFELSHWCGTSAFLFERLEGATKEGRDHALRGWLARGLDDLDDDVIEQVAPALPYGDYLPMLLEVIPRLTLPGRSDDYFSHESVATWGIDGFWGLPWYPHTPYYRTFETKIDSEAHLYELVVPMVPSTWNDAERVAEYEGDPQRGQFAHRSRGVDSGDLPTGDPPGIRLLRALVLDPFPARRPPQDGGGREDGTASQTADSGFHGRGTRDQRPGVAGTGVPFEAGIRPRSVEESAHAG